MPIISFSIEFAGESSAVPRLGRLHSDDVLATVTSAGYMDKYLQTNDIALFRTDMIAVTAFNGTQWYQPVFTATSVQLIDLI